MLSKIRTRCPKKKGILMTIRTVEIHTNCCKSIHVVQISYMFSKKKGIGRPPPCDPITQSTPQLITLSTPHPITLTPPRHPIALSPNHYPILKSTTLNYHPIITPSPEIKEVLSPHLHPALIHYLTVLLL